MIIEGIANVFKGALLYVLGLLPSVDIALPEGFMGWFTDLVTTTAYFLPLVDFMAMLGIWLVVTNFTIIWKVIQRVWDAIPLT